MDLLPVRQLELGLTRVTDVGCGLGYFSELLVELGFDTRAIEGRAGNISEARLWVPGLVGAPEASASQGAARH